MAEALKTQEATGRDGQPDGIITTQAGGQTFVVELFFNHDSKETFRDKLLKVILADRTA